MNNKLVNLIFKYSQIVMLIIIFVFLVITTPGFFTVDNISNVIMQQVPFLLIIAMGMTMAILTKGIDLSIGSNLALTSCVAAFFLQSGNNFLGVLLAIVIGVTIGFFNGILITKVHLVPFIATYTMNMVVRGMAYLFTGGLLFYGFDKKFRAIACRSIGGISNLFIIAILIFVILLFILKKTTFGRNVYSIGFNKNATSLSGINTDRILIQIYTMNGLLAAITGLLYMARLNAAESTIGNDFTIKMMAATLIGGTPFSGGRGGIERTIIGVFIMMFLTNGMNLNNVSSLWQEAAFGFVIIISLLINKIGEKITGTSTQ